MTSLLTVDHWSFSKSDNYPPGISEKKKNSLQNFTNTKNPAKFIIPIKSLHVQQINENSNNINFMIIEELLNEILITLNFSGFI